MMYILYIWHPSYLLHFHVFQDREPLTYHVTLQYKSLFCIIKIMFDLEFLNLLSPLFFYDILPTPLFLGD